MIQQLQQEQGQRLRQLRRAGGITLHQLNAATKISLGTLHLIEHDRFRGPKSTVDKYQEALRTLVLLRSIHYSTVVTCALEGR